MATFCSASNHLVAIADVRSKERKKRHCAATPRILLQAHRNPDLQGKLKERLQTTVAERQLLKPGQKVLVAVSGGQDSVCLIRLLWLMQASWRWRLGIVHCDHQWSSSSRQQASHVAQLAAGLEIDYFQAVTSKAVLGEGIARVWRYGVVHRIAASHGYGAVVTAHTASDRIETMLYNLFRGSGLRGLHSLAWTRLLSPSLSIDPHLPSGAGRVVAKIQDCEQGEQAVEVARVELVRPLLHTGRTELRHFCQQYQLPLWPDPSNHSLVIQRNRIRHQLLPYLRHHFQPEIDKSLARCAEIVQGEDLYLEDLCRTILSKAETAHWCPTGQDGGRKLNMSLLQALPAALQRRIIKQFLEKFTGRSVTFDHVEGLRLTCLQPPKSWQMSLPGGFSIHLTGSEIILSMNDRDE